MKTDVNQVKDNLLQHIALLKEKYNIKQLGVFGSVARGENINASDLDILVEFSEPIGFFKFVELEDYLSKILGVKVDLVTKNALKSAIKEDILKDVVYV